MKWRITLAALVAVIAAVFVVPCLMVGYVNGEPAAQAAVTSPTPQIWQDQNPTTVVQDLLLLDHNGAPIWWVNNAGGMEVGNDKLGITGPDVTKEIVYLTPAGGGEVVVNGQTLTAGDIRMLHRLEAAHLTNADLRNLARLAAGN